MGSPASSNYSVQQISPAPSADSPPGYSSNTSYLRHNSINKSTTSLNAMTANTTPDKNNQTKQSIDSSNFDCGICLKDECLCETVGLKDPKPEDSQKVLDEKLKSFKPMAAVSLSSKKKRPVSAMNDNVKEIDFTQKFKSKPMPDLKKLKKSASVSNGFEFNENSPVENCGFCSDDTPCVCREAAKEAALINENLNRQASVTTNSEMGTKSLPPIQVDLNNGFRKSSLPVMHPGPSVEISNIANLTPGAVPNVVTPTTRRSDSVSSMIKNSSTTDLSEEKSSNSDGGCTGNPGTCRQCQMDPMSTLFCTTVASKNQAPTSATVAGGILSRSGSKTNLPSFTSLNAGTNSSTTSSMNSRPSTPGPNSSNSGIFIPCADAYKTLSRHKNFNSADFGTLVGKLTTRGMQVEVQSVANVLRELDRRLYN
ncbi:uncharacterized protein RJT21DRAFT_120435 [Scheffersomyces amazonensis]|uniref:uncharacterized protein n=1 Tax=Scheffersomyces amazonensis TaxID=1078765 RepID=UPI00315CA9F7